MENGSTKTTDMDDLKKNTIISEMKKYVQKFKAPDGSLYDGLPLQAVQKLASAFHLPTREVEGAALENKILPSRYSRNIGTIGFKGQARLLKSKVAVVGLGGLGGTAAELLARLGVGQIIALDAETFEESDLNRQLLATEENMGEEKTISAVKRAAKINSSVEVFPYQIRAGEKEFREILKGADVIIDALDTFSARLVLQKTAKDLKTPLVHGAIAGFVGEVTTIFPEDPGLDLIYGLSHKDEKGAEMSLGAPTATPAIVAALQVQEVVKVLLKIGKPLRNRLLFLDCETCSVEVIELKS
ncbi:MAG: HesA/MoeB/ThiF family protein [Actinomycetota bacterium]|nr:HesA/MoeB/ThiF family protein [Actinomycetota bacterium]